MNICDLCAKITSEPVREAFSVLLVEIGKSGQFWFEPESHGYMSSLRIRRGSDWCFSVSPAAEWLLFYIRPPELRRGLLSFEIVKESFPEAGDRKDDHITVRLRSEADVKTVMGLIEEHS